MIALIADFSHRFAMNRWVRAWLRIHPVFRLLLLWLIAAVTWPLLVGLLVFLSLSVSIITGGFLTLIREAAGFEDLIDAAARTLGSFSTLCCCVSWLSPNFLFGTPLAIFIVEVVYTRWRIGRFVRRDGGILGTKAEYLGSYPLQPHPRFVYLVLAGTRSNPEIIMHVGRDIFTLPVIDVVGDRPAARDVYIHWLYSLLGGHANLVIRYAGEAGRIYAVEFSSFWGGAIEAQKWVNFIVSSRYEAETGEEPYHPWKSLTASSEEA
jgi:hypothetical protein